MTSAVDKYIKFNPLKVTLSVFQCTYNYVYFKKTPLVYKKQGKVGSTNCDHFWENRPSLRILYFEKLKYLMHCASPVVQYNHIRYLV